MTTYGQLVPREVVLPHLDARTACSGDHEYFRDGETEDWVVMVCRKCGEVKYVAKEKR